MKKAKTLISVILAVMLVFTMALSSFAAGEGSITITNAVSGQTYAIYKMFSLVPSTEGGESYLYEAEDAWEGFLNGTGADYVEVDGDTIVWKGTTNDDGVADADAVAEFAKLALAYAEANGISATASSNATSSTVSFTNLDLGYYLVDSSLGALCGLTSTNPTATVAEKNAQPTVEKTVKEDSTEEYGASNTASIGDTVEFKTVITAQAGAENYVLHDTMDKGLTFNADSVVVKNDSATLTAGTDYTLTTTGLSDGCTFEINFSDDFAATLEANETITVTYTAVLNESAKISTETNDNETHLTYGDNNKTASSVTKTEAFKFDIVKTDENKTLINGAEFRLYSDEACTNEIAVVYDTEKGYYRPAVTGETGEVIKAGTVTVAGLDADTQTKYYLKEIQAPEGYNLLTSPVTVDLMQTGAAANLTAVTTADAYVEGGVQVINDSGSILPSTGGIGTVIFYVIGGLLVAGAVVLLITKKKMSAETK